MADEKRTVGDGRFILEDLIGRGGVGEVWRATGASGGREFALKLLRPEYASDPLIRRRFAREARAATRLSHPNLVTVYAFGGDSGDHFIAMELVDGPSVAHAVVSGLSIRNVLELADRLLAGLAHAHARGVIHRDLKPDNVLLAGARLPGAVGTPKIVDFGIATVPFDTQFVDERDTQQNEVVGTPRYMSPEQALGERDLGPRTDIYNVGLILYELVTGHPPFGGDAGLAVMSRHVHEPIPPVVARAGLTVPDDLRAIIERSLEKKPLDRWSSAGEMRVALQPLLEAAREDQEANQAPEPLESTPQAVKSDHELRITTPNMRPDLVEATRKTLEEQPGPEDELAPWGPLIPFVGRERERAFLMRLAEYALQSNAGTVVLIDGEAGVGKTRMTRWLSEDLEEQGLFRSNVGAFTRGGSGGLRGLQEVLESMFRTRGLSRERAALRIDERLKEWGHDSRADVSALTDFVRPAAVDDTRPNSVSAQALFALIARVLELAARRKPRLVVLDDIQWAGRELIDFLDYFAVELRHRRIPILVLATIRNEDLAERPELESRLRTLSRYQGESVERISLSRLDTMSARDLVARTLPSSEELSNVILERSGGNPLHLLMLLRYLRDEGLLQWREDQWHAPDIEQVKNAVPPSLGDLFSGRIAQAEGRSGIRGRLHSTLSCAAVLGFRFPYDVLRRMLELLGEVDQVRFLDLDLDRMLAEGFLVEIDSRAGEWFAFGHGLLRDYLISKNSAGFARRAHRMAAEAWEAVLGQAASTYAFEIAGHWRAAKEDEKALEWYSLAGESAWRAFALRQAFSSYRAALEIMDRRLGFEANAMQPLGPGLDLSKFRMSKIAPEAYLRTLARLGDLAEGFGDFADAETAYRRVVRLVSRETEELPPAFVHALGYSWLGLGHIAWQRGDFEAAEWAFRKVREIVRPHGSVAMLDADGARGLARVAWHRGEYDEAAALAQEAMDVSAGVGHVAGEAESEWLLGEVDRMLGATDDAKQRYARSMSLYRKASFPSGTVRNLLSLAQVARYQQDFSSAHDLYSRALAHFENLGDRRGQGQALNGLGDIARFQDDNENAERFYTRALELYEAIGAEYDIGIVLANLGINSIAIRDYEAAEGYLQAALATIHGGDYPYLLAGIEYNLAVVHATRGRVSDEEIQGIVDLAETLPIADIDYAEPLERLAQLQADSGKREGAIALWEKARQLYDELGLESDRDRIDKYLKRE